MDKQRYWVEVEPEHWAYLDYNQQDDVLWITHTFVPPELRGHGSGKVLMEKVLEQVEKHGYKVKAICSYAVHYLQRNPKWQHLVEY
ncbi:MAG: GNAT family N-acetyltransferase [Vibrio sp.]